MFLHMIIDGRNVMRSRWPNAGERELVEAIARWAAEHARTPIVAVVFDGTYEGEGPGMYEHDERTVVVATEGEIADDVIVREVEELRAASEPVIVATSDRELRERVEAHGAKVIGGGSFLRTVLPEQ
jgi:predicted RNA-binding protein with PIN domain